MMGPPFDSFTDIILPFFFGSCKKGNGGMRKIGKVYNFSHSDWLIMQSKAQQIGALHKMAAGGYQNRGNLWYNNKIAAEIPKDMAAANKMK